MPLERFKRRFFYEVLCSWSAPNFDFCEVLCPWSAPSFDFYDVLYPWIPQAANIDFYGAVCLRDAPNLDFVRLYASDMPQTSIFTRFLLGGATCRFITGSRIRIPIFSRPRYCDTAETPRRHHCDTSRQRSWALAHSRACLATLDWSPGDASNHAICIA